MLTQTMIVLGALLAAQAGIATAGKPIEPAYAPGEAEYGANGELRPRIQLGPRPGYLIDVMNEGPLKSRLASCVNKRPRKTDFSIGHRGAPLMFPEHTRESYIAAAGQGAGIMECDVAFTSDRELVCRHSQCDLHTTTNILATPLAKKCTQGFVPNSVDFAQRRADGLNIIAPPMFALLASNGEGDIVPSHYAELAAGEGLDFITWTIGRSGRIVEDVLEGGSTFCYQKIFFYVENDGDIYTTLHALAYDVGIVGIFSDWPATVTYYANCMGL